MSCVKAIGMGTSWTDHVSVLVCKDRAADQADAARDINAAPVAPIRIVVLRPMHSVSESWPQLNVFVNILSLSVKQIRKTTLQ